MSITLNPDIVVGPAKIVRTGTRTHVETTSGERHGLLANEVLTHSRQVGTTGVLVRRDTSFYVSYHFVNPADVRKAPA